MKEKNITDVIVREMKCFWKTKPRSSEEVAIKKAGVSYRCSCNFCTGYDKRCNSYVRRVIHYIPLDK